MRTLRRAEPTSLVAMAAVLASLVAGCGGAPPPVPPSKRAQLVARRHVLVVAPDGGVPSLTDADGAIVVLDGVPTHGASVVGVNFDLPRCAQVCAGASAPGERVVGCFSTPSNDELARRMNIQSYVPLIDCAFW